MPTAAELAYFTDKKLMGYQDWDTRLLRYLQNDIREATKRLFIQGAFAEILPLASAAVDQVQVNLKTVLGDGFAHDGAGRILDLEQIDRTAAFENTTGTTYEVGAAYIEYPFEIRNNPRTGKPEYDRLIEGIGVEAEPNSVTNNGANLTIRVDSLFEQGVGVADHAGRVVRVYKKVPDSTLASEAIEEVTVFFGGGQNQITTAGLLGQTTVSVDPADYVVQLVGIIVLKDTATNRPSQNPTTNFFIGTVDGDTGNIPSSFDTSGQATIQAQSAGAVVFLPYNGAAPISWSISAVTVQTAIEEIVDDLTNNGGGTEGARLIALQSTGFNQTNPSATLSWGGLGTSGDEVFTKLSDANRQLVRSRFGMTHSVAQATIQADFQGPDDIDTFGFETHWLKGGGDFEFTLTELSEDNWPIVHGEGPGKTRLFAPAAQSDFPFRGTFRNMTLGSTLAAVMGDNGFFHAENCVIAPNCFELQGGESVNGPNGYLARAQTQSIRSCYFPDSVSGAGTPRAAVFSVDRFNHGGCQLIENTVFYTSDGSTPIDVDGSTNTPGSEENKVIRVFVNCLFIQNGASGYAGVVDAEDVHFINCGFFILSTANAFPAISCGQNAENVTFDKCWVVSVGGRLVDADASPNIEQITFRDCHFETGASPVNGRYPWRSENVNVINCRIELGRSSMASTVQNQSMWIHDGGRFEGNEISWHGSPGWYPGTDWFDFGGFAMIEKNTWEFSSALSPNDDPLVANVTGIIATGGATHFNYNKLIGTLKPSSTVSRNDIAIVTLQGKGRGNYEGISTNSPLAGEGWRAYFQLDGDYAELYDTTIRHTFASGYPSVTQAYFLNRFADHMVVDGVDVIMDFHANSPAIDFFVNTFSNYFRFKNVRWTHRDFGINHPENAQFCAIDGGKHGRIEDHLVIWDGDTPIANRFVYFRNNDIANDVQHTHVRGNQFCQDTGSVNRSVAEWININSGGTNGDYSLIVDNILLNAQALVPTLSIGGSTGSIGDATNNIFAANVSSIQ